MKGRLEEKALEAINSSTPGWIYDGALKVVYDDGIYSLFLYLDQNESPLVIAKDCDSEDDFFDFVKKEIKSRKMQTVRYWKAIQELPVLECIDGELKLDRDKL